MKIYLATWFEDRNGQDLSTARSDKRLISYFGCLVNRVEKKRLHEYVKKGFFTK